MRYGKIMLAFWIILPLSVILRAAQLYFTVDAKTGFFLPEFEFYGNLMLILIFLCALVVIIFSFNSHRSPERVAKNNIFISFFSILFGASILICGLFEKFPSVVPSWQISVLKVLGYLTSAFLIVFGLTIFLKFKLQPILTVLPVLYLIARIIADFTSISTLAIISDNLIIMAAYSLSLLSFFYFSKFCNKISSDWDNRKLLAFGLSASLLCLVQSVPNLFFLAFSQKNYIHTSLNSNVNLLNMGLLILIFILSHFSYNNACLKENKN